jgi:hypothetical protein
MKLLIAVSSLLVSNVHVRGFTPLGSGRAAAAALRMGYLDNLSEELYKEDDSITQEDIDASSKSATDLPKSQVSNAGVGDWSTYKDFGDEFDGGDGQMGVAGDGNKGLEKFGQESELDGVMSKSKSMSAKNAWGTSTGYAAVLIEEGVEETRAQQLENWKNQQEVTSRRKEQQAMAEAYDTKNEAAETNQWDLSKFGVERNQEFDMEEAFGADASVGQVLDGTIELASRINTASVHEFSLKNEYMGFADFRAAFTPGTAEPEWTVEPSEGALSKEATNFIVKFRPQNPGAYSGYLVIETEDFKKTYALVGSTA